MRVLHFVAAFALTTIVLGGTPAEWKQRTIYQVKFSGLHAVGLFLELHFTGFDGPVLHWQQQPTRMQFE